MGSPSHYQPHEPRIISSYKASQDRKVQTAAASIGLPVTKIDIRVFIYRPDKPVRDGDSMFNDITIKNLYAVD